MISARVAAAVLPVHPEAVEHAREASSRFDEELLTLARLMAYSDDATLVLPKHVREALRQLRVNRGRRLRQELSKVVGAALFGAFLGGFFGAVLTGQAALVIVFTAMGMFGMALLSWGFHE